VSRADRWKPALILTIALGIGLLHFLLVVADPAIVLGHYPKWADPGGDETQMVMGVTALLRDRWHFPLPATSLLSFGPPTSIVFTDSVPWLSVLAKALGLGPGDVSVLGVTLALNFILQPVAFAVFLWALGIRRIEILLGGVLLGCMLPAWYMRASGHIALSAHWLLALGLAVTAWAIRTRVSWRVIAVASALGALALGIHAYLFVMVTAVLLAALLADLFRPRPGAVLRTLAGLVIFLAVQAVAAEVLGYWAGGGAGAGYALYSMNLLSPFVPQLSGLRALLTGNPGPVIAALGGQWEGYNYLGAGLFAVIIAALLVVALGRWQRPAASTLRAAIPLVAALAGLTILAISNEAYAGHLRVYRFALPPEWQAVLSQIRSSGRLFWVVGYALLGAALAVLARARGRAAIGVLMAAAVVLQAVDTDPLREGLRNSTQPHAEAPLFAWAPWRGPLAGRDVRLVPDFSCAAAPDMEAMRQLALVVVRHGGRVSNGPTSRVAADACRQDVILGATPPSAPDVLNAVFRHSTPDGELFMLARTGKCGTAAFGLVCGADHDGLPTAEARHLLPPAVAPGRTVSFTQSGTGAPYLGAGWSGIGGNGVWSDGKQAALVLPLPPDWHGDARLVLRTSAYTPPGRHDQPVTVMAGGQALAHWTVTSGHYDPYGVTVPASAISDGVVVLTLDMPEAVSPLQAQGAGDVRELGLELQSLTLEPVLARAIE